MPQIKVRTTTIRKKDPDKPQKQIQMRKTVINNQIMRLNANAKKGRV